MFKKILLILTVFMTLCISVCAESVSYDVNSKIVENTGKFAIVKKGAELYFSGEDNYINISLEKGDKITLLKWKSYADLKPLADPFVYTACTIDYMCEEKLVESGMSFLETEQKFPKIDEKQGYEIKWNLKQTENHIVANAEYVIKDYKVTFKADGKVIGTDTYNINNTSVSEPAVPKKEGYNGKWEDYTLTYSDKEINAVYTPIEYTVTFEGSEKKNFNIENMNVEEPEVPEKEGYSGKWEEYTLTLNNITVKAVYELIEYEVKFEADEENVSTEKYTIENKSITKPSVPEKTGYTGKWEAFELNLENITVKAIYTPIEYKVTFKADNFEVVKLYTVENKRVEEPEVPEKKGYEGTWEAYELSTGDVLVNAVYRAKTFTVSFDVNGGEALDISQLEGFYVENGVVKKEATYGSQYGELPAPTHIDETLEFAGWTVNSKPVGNIVEITENSVFVAVWTDKPVYTVTFNDYYGKNQYRYLTIVEGQKADEPEKPVKNGYEFAGWYTDAFCTTEYDFSQAVQNEISLYPKWNIITYTVTFVADGETVKTETYTVENPTITKPVLPKKTGYNGKWENYTLTYGNVTVNAVYTPVTYSVYFLDEKGNVVDIKTYTIENPVVEEPLVPAKTGYEGKWQPYTLDAKTVSVSPLYTLINYSVTFIADNETVDVKSYTYTNAKITEPNVPEKEGYTAKWETYSLNFENITVKAIYTPIEYKVTFVAEQSVVAEEVYTVENKYIYTPAVPQKEGYTAKWESYSLNLENITVNAVYTPIEYTVTFIADSKEISVQKFNVENMNITEPLVPGKEGYTATWESYSIGLKNINVKAVYELIEYTATFKIEGKIVSEQKFSVENMNVASPAIPEKTGYTSKWENYELSLTDITVNAVYELITYTVKFVANGNTVASENYTVENMTINEPEVPAKNGYTGKWTEYSLNLKSCTVIAVYTPIEYTAKFVVDGVEISSHTYTVETGSIVEPEVPSKEWYDGKWETYSLDVGGVTISPVYTLATYTISFKADGIEIGSQSYDFNKQTVTLPAIPEKAGYRAVWEKYEVVPGGMTINVRYISPETDAENAEEKLHFTNMVNDFGETIDENTYIGYEQKILKNIQAVGKGILADIEYGIVITEEHIKTEYQQIIQQTKEYYNNVEEKEKFKTRVARIVKDDDSFRYFEAFYKKYF